MFNRYNLSTEIWVDKIMVNLKAVILVVGLDMNMLPATKAIPKEILPIVDKQLIQYIVDEVVAAGSKKSFWSQTHRKNRWKTTSIHLMNWKLCLSSA